MLEQLDALAARWFRIESFRQVVAYSILTTIFTTLVSTAVVGAALWPMPAFAFVFGVSIAAFIPLFLTIPLAFGVFYMMLLITRTIDQVSSLVKYDPLTGVYTRAHFLAETQRAYNKGGVFMMVDADHFKKINDNHGHVVGDEALKAVAAALTASVGDIGLVGRLGGEEFGVFLPKASAEKAAKAAERIREVILAKGMEIEPLPLRLTVSMGAAAYFAGRSLTDMMKLADQLLYAAKRAGRDRAFVEGVSIVEAELFSSSP